jgi:1-acyl-sn-glycerol-3-phosphate acyltransferase
MKRLIGSLILKAFRTRVVGDAPADPVCVLVCAPHTSNWDFILMLGIAWSAGIDPAWLGKKEMFRGPLGPLFRKLGGISIDREAASGAVDDLVDAAKVRPHLAIVIPAEGTRDKGTYWKSGFRRIAAAADIPIVLAFVGGPDNTCGFGPRLEVTDDVVADMDVIREFYADKGGLRPDRFTPPKLREEEAAATGAVADH